MDKAVLYAEIRAMLDRLELAEPVDPAQLRVPCGAGERTGRGMHKHECPACQAIWKHSDELSGGGCTKAEFEQAHTCPRCGETEVTLKM